MFLSSAAFRKFKSGYRPPSSTPYSQGDVQSVRPTDKDQLVLDAGSLVSSETFCSMHADIPETVSPPTVSPMVTHENLSFHTDRLKGFILDPARMSERKEDSFCPGNDSTKSREQRNKWLSIENELHHVQSLASRSVHSSSTHSQIQLLEQLREAIMHAMHYLLEGENMSSKISPIEDNPFKLETDPKAAARSFDRKKGSSKNPLYYVWSSPQMARSAIVQEAIAAGLKQSNAARMKNARGLVLLVIERRPNLSFQSAANNQDANREFSEQESFLSSWTRATFGIADTITVAVEKSDQIHSSIQKLLQKASTESFVVPTLVCLHASGESTVPCNLSAVRALCEVYQTRLCVEGSALALVAQPNRPSTPEECVRKAHVMLLDPGSWFGFKMCAVVTRHEPCISRGSNHRRTQHHDISSIDVLASCDNEDKHGFATGSVLNLWTVLSRIGLTSIRGRIEKVTAVAESFLYYLENSPNIQVKYDGIGCVISMSYIPSMEDRLLSAEKATQNVSNVNRAVICGLEEESKGLLVYTVQTQDVLHIQFSPSRFLSSGTFWCPSEDDVYDYVSKVQAAVNKYEPCKAGRAEFDGRVIRCRDIDTVAINEDTPGLALSLGAFRIVPYEISTSGRGVASFLDVVNDLCSHFVSELKHSLAVTVARNYALQREFERCGIVPKQALQKGYETSNSRNTTTVTNEETYDSTDSDDELPFVVYLNSNLENGVPDFLSLEPKVACNAVQAVRQARLAAELILTFVDVVVSRWRERHLLSTIPKGLSNVAGVEGFVLNKSSHDGLKRGNRANVSPPRNLESGKAGADIAQGVVETLTAEGHMDLFVETDSDDESLDSTLQSSEQSSSDNEKDASETESLTPSTTGTSDEGQKNEIHEAGAEREPTLSVNSHVAQAEGQDMCYVIKPGSIAVQPGREPRQETAVAGNAGSARETIPVRSHWLGIWSRAAKGERLPSQNGDDERDEGHDDYDEDASYRGEYSGGSEDADEGEDADADRSLPSSDESDDDREEEEEGGSSVEEETEEDESSETSVASGSESYDEAARSGNVGASRGAGILRWLRGSGKAEAREATESRDGDWSSGEESDGSELVSGSVETEEEAEHATEGKARARGWSWVSRGGYSNDGEEREDGQGAVEAAGDEAEQAERERGEESESGTATEETETGEESAESLSDEEFESESGSFMSESDEIEVGDVAATAGVAQRGEAGSGGANADSSRFGFVWLRKRWGWSAGDAPAPPQVLVSGTAQDPGTDAEGSAGAVSESSSRSYDSGSSSEGTSSGTGTRGSESEWSSASGGEAEGDAPPGGTMGKYLGWMAGSVWGGQVGAGSGGRTRSERYGGSEESDGDVGHGRWKGRRDRGRTRGCRMPIGVAPK